MSNLEDVKYFETLRLRFEVETNFYRIMRDCNILKAFESGLRQKEIANALGLSESRVKKIIGEMRTK
jgi:DNA-directed RNA polymerase specialized sigma subunit